jgi:hypothetical protein
MHDKYCRAGRALSHSHHDAQLAEMMVARCPIPVSAHTADAHLGQVKPCKDQAKSTTRGMADGLAVLAWSTQLFAARQAEFFQGVR